MKRLLTLVLSVLLSAATLSAQNANIKYSGDAQPGDKVYSCAFDGYVNMREAPSYQATKVGKFSNGSTGAELIQNLGEWMEIDNNGVRGFVPSRFVQDEPTVAYTGSATVNDITGMWRAGFFGPLSIISAGGATTMDTVLPSVIRYSGKKYAILSIYQGFVVDFSVPFMVTLFCTI